MDKSATTLSPYRKNWSQYLLEFILLFTAVTLGFFAENLREKFSERNKEKQYLTQLLQDLQQDTAKINFCVNFKVIKEQQADSLIELITRPDRDKFSRLIYYYSRIIVVREPFYGTEGTFNQLQNDGGFRLITNRGLIHELNQYEAARQKIYQIQEMQDLSSLEMRGVSSRLFDAKTEHQMLDIEKNQQYRYFVKAPDQNIPLASNDPSLINEYCNWISWMMSAEQYDHVLLLRLKKNAIQLMATLDSELKKN
jgi:hypothetical protein